MKNWLLLLSRMRASWRCLRRKLGKSTLAAGSSSRKDRCSSNSFAKSSDCGPWVDTNLHSFMIAPICFKSFRKPAHSSTEHSELFVR
eukprot:730980-Lingulodinium_polyedra.AAC.1